MSVVKADPAELEQSLGYRFRDPSLLARALTHSSSANEKNEGSAVVSADVVSAAGVSADNERLEFLGDAILGWLVSEWLFSRFSGYSEGRLSLVKNHLVSASHLLAAAHRLDLGRYLQLGRGEETAGGRSKQRLLVNAFEAVLAAVYLDGGPVDGADAARNLVSRHVLPDDATVAELAGAGPPQDFRAELERMARDRDLPRPVYTALGETGPGHARRFTVEARVGKTAATGDGSSKKAASHAAARELCRLLREDSTPA